MRQKRRKGPRLANRRGLLSSRRRPSPKCLSQKASWSRHGCLEGRSQTVQRPSLAVLAARKVGFCDQVCLPPTAPNGSELRFSPVSVTALARLLDARGVGTVLCARLMHFLTPRRHQLVLQRQWRRRRRSSASRGRSQLLLLRLDQHLTILLLPRELGVGMTRFGRSGPLCVTPCRGRGRIWAS